MNFPLLLTASRLVLAIVVGTLLVLEDAIPFHVSIAAACFIVASLTDFFDGRLARKWNQATPLGAFLDPLADKLLVYLAFIYLTTVLIYPVWLLLILFGRDMAVDGLRAFSVGKGVAMPANLIGKWKSFLQMGSIALLLALVSVTEVQRLTSWGNEALTWVLTSTGYEVAFGATYWLMLAAAAVGLVSMVQYFVESAPKLFRSSSHA